jgi:hypothetical protein
MKAVLGVLLICITSAGWLGDVSAERQSVPCSVMEGTDGLLVQTAGALAQEPTIVLRENEDIIFAKLYFYDDLDVGTEVEIWPAVEGEVPPWEFDPSEVPFTRNIWILDERTDDLVQFDVTQIVRMWQREELPNLGFVVRVVTDGEEETEEQAALAALAGSKDFHLIYSIEPVRPPRPDGGGPDEEVSSGKPPGINEAGTGKQ